MRYPRRVGAIALGLGTLFPTASGVIVAGPAAAAPGDPINCLEPSPFAGDKAFTQQLAIPKRVRPALNSTVTLKAMNGRHKFHSSQTDQTATHSLGYADITNGASPPADLYGGPTIEARTGVPFKVKMQNDAEFTPLAQHIVPHIPGSAGHAFAPYGVVHLHGAIEEHKDDGLPLDRVQKGSFRTYEYDNRQDSAGLWYHDHYLGNTRISVGAGLAGQYWIRDDRDTGAPGNPLNLPVNPAPNQPGEEREIPLTIQDRSFTSDLLLPCMERFTKGTTMNTWEPESYGNTAVVNGTAFPVKNVNQRNYRFRMLNGSSARFYELVLIAFDKNGQLIASPKVEQIGSDGGLFDRPLDLTSQMLPLAPGQRADLVVDFSTVPTDATVVMWNTAKGFPWDNGTPDPANFPDIVVPDLPQIMRFKVGGSKIIPPAVANPLRTGMTPGPSGLIQPLLPKVTHQREVRLNQTADGFFINNLPYTRNPNNCTEDPIDKTCVWASNMFFHADVFLHALDTVEEWTIVNQTSIAHPIHPHGTQFQIRGREGAGGTIVPPLPSEQGWHDTVTVKPNERVHILVPYGGRKVGIPAPYDLDPDLNNGTPRVLAGESVVHCHILDHEDMDMMQPTGNIDPD